MADLIDNGIKISSKQEEKVKEPEEYRVVLLNDDYTTMEFVVEVLMLVFHLTHADASKIMLDVHHKGRGTVGIYSFDIAQTKANQVHAIARKNEFPLRCVVEQA